MIKDVAKIARPITNLMPTPLKKSQRRKTKQSTSDKTWKWDKEQDKAFNTLKSCLISPPVLGYPDFNKSFELHTDASSSGLGAVLYQEQEGKNRVIAYASRSLTKSEQRYPAYRLEFLALKWAVTEKFSDYLRSTKFKVLTDNNPLTYVLTSAKLDATTQRWIAALSSYDFEIFYRPGINNADADSMSRLPGLLQNKDKSITSESIKAICNLVHDQPAVETLSLSADVTDVIDSKSPLMPIDVKNLQEKDQVINYWISHVRSGCKPAKNITPRTPEHRALYQNFY